MVLEVTVKQGILECLVYRVEKVIPAKMDSYKKTGVPFGF